MCRRLSITGFRQNLNRGVSVVDMLYYYKTMLRVGIVTVLGVSFAGFGGRNVYLSYFHTVLWYNFYFQRGFFCKVPNLTSKDAATLIGIFCISRAGPV